MTTATLAAPTAGPIGFGRVLRSTVDALKANLWAYVALVAIFGAIPAGVGAWIINAWAHGGAAGDQSALLGATYVVGGIERIVSYPMIGGVTAGVLAQFKGQRLSFQTCLSKGLGLWGGLFGLNFLVGLRVGLGLLLLIVPGVIWSIMWVVATPAKVAEDRSISRAISRSAELTKGRRWSVFGFVLLLGVSYFIIHFLAGFIAQLAVTLAPSAVAVRYVMTGAAQLVISPFAIAAMTCLYQELRTMRGGGAPDEVANVFT